MINRDVCVVCGRTRLAELLQIAGYPVFQGCVTSARGGGETAPMTWMVCEDCGAAQIARLPPLDTIYQAGHATGLGASWTRHHAAFAQFLIANARGAIADVGGGSGTLAIAYRRAGGASAFSILEPNALRAEGLPADIGLVDGFLEEAALAQTGATTVVMCHMLEHVVDLRAALLQIQRALPADGRICIAWPELEHWTARDLAGALNFEHGVYLTVPTLLSLFAEFGWREMARQHWAENDTLFLALERGSADVPQVRSDGAQAVPGYFARLREQAVRMQRVARGHGGDVFLMPASVYSQSLLALGLEEECLSGILDNAPAKQGRRLFGTSLSVFPATTLRTAHNPLVLLNAGAHDAEIAASLLALRPDLRIVGKD